MSNIIFFGENEVRRNLLPLVFTRPTSCLRVGIDTIRDKWQAMLGPGHRYSHLTASYLKAKYPAVVASTNLLVAGHVLPTPELAAQVAALQPGQALLAADDSLVAFCGCAAQFDERQFNSVATAVHEPAKVTQPWHIFGLNSQEIRRDFERITAGRQSAPIPSHVTVIGEPSQVFAEPGAVLKGCILDATTGPIYIGRDAEVMPGACIQGPFAMLDGSKVKMGAKIYGATTLGPQCKVGGEVENTVFQGYSNKAHDGFVGDAVIGEWCNIGGGTTASNLKNDYGEVKLWNYGSRRFVRTGLQFCGLIMGDHCKTGVNCMINTATVLGVGVNIHGSGFPRNFVASFHEGSSNGGFKRVRLDAFLALAQRVMARRGIELTQADRDMYQAIYEISKQYS